VDEQSVGNAIVGGSGEALPRATGHGERHLLPTRCRRARGLILLTFGEANDQRRASGGGLKFLVFNGGARPQLSFSGIKKQL
jgi:hypothetical protein